MRIQTLEYNANQPLLQQITVPLTSNYAVGVKVYRDGKPVECGMDAITIDGLSTTSQVAGYNVYELSSDDKTGMKLLDVNVNTPNSYEFDVVSSGTKNGIPFGDLSWEVKISLSDYIVNSTVIAPENFGTISSVNTITNNSGVLSVIEKNPPNYINIEQGVDFDLAQYFPMKKEIWARNTVTENLHKRSCITIGPDSILGFNAIVPKSCKSNLSCYISFTANDALSAKFKLQVQAKDLGYFEV